mmetsp:Transcript_19625/g.64930  ORF Transcript_19625/g.64930 Transcript_19625/m.64930 type:complete len:207 (-) Transcript_19625:97-717(-)
MDLLERGPRVARVRLKKSLLERRLADLNPVARELISPDSLRDEVANFVKHALAILRQNDDAQVERRVLLLVHLSTVFSRPRALHVLVGEAARDLGDLRNHFLQRRLVLGAGQVVGTRLSRDADVNLEQQPVEGAHQVPHSTTGRAYGATGLRQCPDLLPFHTPVNGTPPTVNGTPPTADEEGECDGPCQAGHERRADKLQHLDVAR